MRSEEHAANEEAAYERFRSGQRQQQTKHMVNVHAAVCVCLSAA